MRPLNTYHAEIDRYVICKDTLPTGDRYVIIDADATGAPTVASYADRQRAFDHCDRLNGRTW